MLPSFWMFVKCSYRNCNLKMETGSPQALLLRLFLTEDSSNQADFTVAFEKIMDA